jgi:UTP--glucose-1-phosphate uridylyltransferase
MIDQFEESGADAVIALEEVPEEEVVRYGIAVPRNGAAEVFELADLVEKPEVGQVDSNLAVAARYVLSPRIFDCLENTEPDHRGEIQLTDAIRMLIQQGRRVLGVRLAQGQSRFDIGNFESYFQAFVDFAMADPQYGETLQEHLRRKLETESNAEGEG